MKLLLDNNISYRLVKKLTDVNAEILHISRSGLPIPVDDIHIWRFARLHGYIIVTRDEDFCDLQTLYGAPPFVVWLRFGNAETYWVEHKLRNHLDDIRTMISSPETTILEIY